MSAVRTRLVAAAGAVLVTLAMLPARAQDAPPPAVQEWRGAFGGGPSEAVRVARNQAEWAALWASLSAAVPMALPAEAFAVEISLGLRNTGGYAVRIVSAAVDGQAFVVTWAEAAPAPSAITTQALSDPYVVRLIPRTALAVTFRKTP